LIGGGLIPADFSRARFHLQHDVFDVIDIISCVAGRESVPKGAALIPGRRGLF
jgi:hypothetical protein